MASRRRLGALSAAALSALAGVAGVQGWRLHTEAAQGYEVPDPPQPGSEDFARLVEALTIAPLRHGNRIEVLRNGDEIFPAMLGAIRGAEHTVDFATFVYWTGDIAIEFADTLAERAASGVDVNVLLDAVGAAKMSRELIGRMEDAGVEVDRFRPPAWHTLHKMNNRTHRKILAVDGRVGFTGGVGIAKEWTGDAEDPDHWRDTHIRIEGPAVRDLVGGFQDNWSEAKGLVLTQHHLPDLAPFEDGHPVQVTRSTATKGSAEAEELLYAAIEGSRSRYWLTTAYFAPRRAFVDALCRAAERGVDVRLLVNGPHIDRWFVRRAGQQSYDRLLRCGVRIFEYQRTMLHAKVLVIDERWCTVGSMNFDDRSYRLNDELNASIASEEIVGVLEKHFLEDLDDSLELRLEAWRSRPVRRRIEEAALALAKRQL